MPLFITIVNGGGFIVGKFSKSHVLGLSHNLSLFKCSHDMGELWLDKILGSC